MSDLVNSTMLAFGYPDTLISRYEHWSVMLRPKQPTLGSLILAANHDATALGALPAAAFTELKAVTADIERALSSAMSYEKINYLMLMMVDPHVHYHVIPRYGDSRTFAAVDYRDAGWPGPPILTDAATLSPEDRMAFLTELKQCWESNL